MIDLNKIDRLPPTRFKDGYDIPPPEKAGKSPIPKRTILNQVVWAAVEYADNIEKAGDIIVAWCNKNLDGKLKYIGVGIGYAFKYGFGYVDKNIARASKKGKKNAKE